MCRVLSYSLSCFFFFFVTCESVCVFSLFPFVGGAD